MDSKPTWKATEFWLSSIGVIGGLILSAIPESNIASIVGSLLAAICGSSYTIGRSLVKSKSETGRSIAEAILKKKQSKEE